MSHSSELIRLVTGAPKSSSPSSSTSTSSSSTLSVSTQVSEVARALIPELKYFILKTGDQSLIDDLLPNLNIDELKSPHRLYHLINDLLLQINASVEEHVTHFERLIDYKVIIKRQTITDEQAMDSLTKSKEDIRRMVGYDNSLGTCDDKYLLAMIKLLLFIKPQIDVDTDKLIIRKLNNYLSTGDLALIPFLASIEYDETVSLIFCIVEHGTLAQAKLLIQYMASKPILQSLFNSLGTYRARMSEGRLYAGFMTSYNSSLKLEVLMMFNDHNIQFDKSSDSRPWLFEGSMDLLEFLVSDRNKIVKFTPLFIDIKHLEYVLDKSPSLISHTQQLQLAVMLGQHDIVQLIYGLRKFNNRELLFELTMAGRPDYDMFQWLMDHHTSKSTTYFERIGQIGDTRMADMAIEYVQRSSSNQTKSLEVPVSLMFEQAIKFNQTQLLTHFYKNHRCLFTTNFEKYHELAILKGNLEQLAILLGMVPLEISFFVFNKAVCYNGAYHSSFYKTIKKVIFDHKDGRPILDCVLKHASDTVRTGIKSVVLPLYTIDLIKKNDIVMLQHLLDIGATFQLKGVTTCSAYKSSAPIQSIIKQYKERQAMNNNKKRGRDSVEDNQETSVQQQVNDTTDPEDDQQPSKINKTK
ncbi:hypothetical protein SAMD00019534_003060 [Acytostelium subglobosum LB1]|uniref:hypothetical protein n=1 Tax=Acytostelium subglobosum LB1 TaxID=1410327 RepID=UPI000644AD95|nr:hypothetical protein SAMD00019534_003060 [Acytostelium subglobosum LB1]GAM17131.1 hypothetical protein SAMD00019534_003060 [Acytostelium subglobosum LB1]|eukprot:XP_012759193.1 hypothetical protein SAMD00019534_003060 [Acytostelium subglobosum LB1]